MRRAETKWRHQSVSGLASTASGEAVSPRPWATPAPAVEIEEPDMEIDADNAPPTPQGELENDQNSDNDSQKTQKYTPQLMPEEMDEAQANRLLDNALKADLKQEACSIYHLMHHKPQNPFCDACRRAKTREKSHKTGSYKQDLQKWGTLVTCDHITSDKKLKSLTNERSIFTIMDLSNPRLKHSYPVKDKTANTTQLKIQHFCGRRKILLMYADNSDEIANACKELCISLDNSTPGIPQNNALIEQANGDNMRGSRTALVQAGLPPVYWKWSIQHYCVAENNRPREDGITPWEHTHKGTDQEKFKALRIPFGAKVMYKPSKTHQKIQDEIQKNDPNLRIGVFAGYQIEHGYTWRGRYLIWDLTDFKGVDLSLTVRTAPSILTLSGKELTNFREGVE